MRAPDGSAAEPLAGDRIYWALRSFPWVLGDRLNVQHAVPV